MKRSLSKSSLGAAAALLLILAAPSLAQQGSSQTQPGAQPAPQSTTAPPSIEDRKVQGGDPSVGTREAPRAGAQGNLPGDPQTAPETGSPALGYPEMPAGPMSRDVPPADVTADAPTQNPQSAMASADADTGAMMCWTVRAEGERCSCLKAPNVYGEAVEADGEGRNECRATV